MVSIIDGVVRPQECDRCYTHIYKMSAANLTGNVTGNLTGNVTGTVSDVSSHDTGVLVKELTSIIQTQDQERHFSH